MAPEPLRWILRIPCVPLLLAAGPLPAEEVATETRVAGLEARLEPGSRLHVSAQLEPGLAKRVRQIRVGHAPGGASPQP